MRRPLDIHFLLFREVRSVLKLVGAVMSGAEPPEGEWQQIRGAILKALAPFDEARRAVREGLRTLGHLGELAPL